MNVQRVRQKIAIAKLQDDERHRSAVARLRADLAPDGEARLERQIDRIVELAVGVRP
jgi:hypothetical protein